MCLIVLLSSTGTSGLNLTSNNLAGTLPDAISKLSVLQYLDLSDNFIRGTIPTGLFLLTRMCVCCAVAACVHRQARPRSVVKLC